MTLGNSRTLRIVPTAKSALVVLNTFPEDFKLEEMKLPEAARACEHEAIWLDEAIFRAGQKGVDDAVAKSTYSLTTRCYG